MDSYTKLLNAISNQELITNDMIELEFSRGLITSQEYEILLNHKSVTLNQILNSLGFDTKAEGFGKKSIIANNEILFTGTAEDVWKWLESIDYKSLAFNK